MSAFLHTAPAPRTKENQGFPLLWPSSVTVMWRRQLHLPSSQAPGGGGVPEETHDGPEWPPRWCQCHEAEMHPHLHPALRLLLPLVLGKPQPLPGFSWPGVGQAGGGTVALLAGVGDCSADAF